MNKYFWALIWDAFYFKNFLIRAFFLKSNFRLVESFHFVREIMVNVFFSQTAFSVNKPEVSAGVTWKNTLKTCSEECESARGWVQLQNWWWALYSFRARVDQTRNCSNLSILGGSDPPPLPETSGGVPSPNSEAEWPMTSTTCLQFSVHPKAHPTISPSPPRNCLLAPWHVLCILSSCCCQCLDLTQTFWCWSPQPKLTSSPHPLWIWPFHTDCPVLEFL